MLSAGSVYLMTNINMKEKKSFRFWLFLNPYRLRSRPWKAMFVLSLLFMQSAGLLFPALVHASAAGTVVINEVAWAGSKDSSTDEWIELYNNSSQAVDLTNWYIDDDHGTSTYKITSGTIAANGYFLIEDHDSAVSTVNADTVIDVSLANDGDSLQLYDATAQLMDTVNGSGGAWYAGSATTKATMERKDPAVTGDSASNWAISTGSGANSSGGSGIIGTPRAANSVASSGGGSHPGSASVALTTSSSEPLVGDVLTVTTKVADVSNLFAYGFDIQYDPVVLRYKSAGASGFLGGNGTVVTSFQAGLENGVQGKLVVAEARTEQTKTGVNGSGDLFTIQFDVIGGAGVNTTIHFGSGGFIASPTSDITASFVDAQCNPQPSHVINPVTNLTVAHSTARYSLELKWNVSSGATVYRVFRKDPRGQWSLLAETPSMTFIDQDSVNGGGYIIPELAYSYRVVAANATTESDPVEAVGTDSRGLKGDNNRSDRVDGRDLENLARHFGETDTDQGFAALTDTTYDGRIDGSDLIDIGANFARIYSS
jgi:hypothetical protein